MKKTFILILIMIFTAAAFGAGSADKSDAVITVAASDTISKLLRNADYRCDGTADEVQINAALDYIATNGGTVHLLAGNYLLSATIEIGDNCTLQGDGWGTVLKLKDSFGSPYQAIKNDNGHTAESECSTVSENIIIRDLKIDGNKYNNTTYGAQCDNSIHINTAKNVVIENVFCLNSGYNGIFAEFSDGVIINKCIVKFTAASGICLHTGSTNCIVSNCVVDSPGYDDKLYFDAGSVAFVADETVTGAAGATSIVESVVVESGSWAGGDAAGYMIVKDQNYSYVDDEALTGSVAGVAVKNGWTCQTVETTPTTRLSGSCYKSMDGGSFITFSGNTAINSCDYGFSVYSHASTSSASNVTITGNTVQRGYIGVYISGVATGSIVQKNITITGNTFASGSIENGYAFYNNGLTENVLFSNNTVYGNAGAAYIYGVAGAVTRCAVINNLFYNESPGTDSSAIKINNEIVDMVISGNIISGWEMWGIYFSSLCDLTNVSVMNNVFTGLTITSTSNAALFFVDTTPDNTNCKVGGNIHDCIAYVYDTSTKKTLSGAAVDKGGGLVGLPSTAHGFVSGDSIFVDSTTNYDNVYTCDETTSTDEIVITATYVAETFASPDSAAKCELPTGWTDTDAN